MLIMELVNRLLGWHNKYGNLEVEAFHNGYYEDHHKIVDITLPQHRRVIQLVTVPLEWLYPHLESKENNEERTEGLRQKEIHLNPDED